MVSSRESSGGFGFENVTAGFGNKSVLHGINLNVSSRQVVAFIGPSGAGKTTLLNLLNASVVASSGVVNVGGLDVARLDGQALRHLRSNIGFVHQDLRLVRNLRVHQNVLTGRFGSQSLFSSLFTMLRPYSENLLEVHRLLEMVGIPEKMYHRVDQLSGGQAQRVAVARALYQRPTMLLADEPVSSVDPARARSIIQLLVGIARKQKLTLGVSLHDPELVRAHFDRVIGLREGQVFFDKAVADVTDQDLASLYELEVRSEV